MTGVTMSLPCRQIVVTALLLLGSLGAIAAQEIRPSQSRLVDELSSPLVLGYFDFPPFIIDQPQGPPTGFMADLMIAMFEHAGLPWKARQYPVKRLYRALARGDVHCQFMPQVPPSVEHDLYMPQPALFQLTIGIYWVRGTTPVDELDALSGKSLLSVLGYRYGGLLDDFEERFPSVTLDQAPDYDSAVRMLKAGRADYLLTYEMAAATAARRQGIQSLEHTPLTTVNYYLAVHESVPRARQIHTLLRKSFLELQDRGVVEALRNKYMSQSSEAVEGLRTLSSR